MDQVIMNTQLIGAGINKMDDIDRIHKIRKIVGEENRWFENRKIRKIRDMVFRINMQDLTIFRAYDNVCRIRYWLSNRMSDHERIIRIKKIINDE